MNETYAPPNRFDRKVAFEIDRYFITLQKMLDVITNVFASEEPMPQLPVIRAKLSNDVDNLLSVYNELITYMRHYASYAPLLQRDIAVFENKFDAIQPQIEQVATLIEEMRLPQAPKIGQMAESVLYKIYDPVDNVKQLNIVKTQMSAQGISTLQIQPEEPYIFPDVESGKVNRDKAMKALSDQRDYDDDEDQNQYLDVESPEDLREHSQFEERQGIAEPATPERDTDVEPELSKISMIIDRAPPDEQERANTVVEGEYTEPTWFVRGKGTKEARAYLATLSNKQVRDLLTELDLYDEVNAKKSTGGIKSKLKVADIRAIYLLKERGFNIRDVFRMAQGQYARGDELRQEIEYQPTYDIPDDPVTRMLEERVRLFPEGDPYQAPPRAEPSYDEAPQPDYEETYADLEPMNRDDEDQELIEGQGRCNRFGCYSGRGKEASRRGMTQGQYEMRSKLPFYGGFGQSEDLMFGLPVGMKKSMLLRPMDRRPVQFKLPDERGERGLSLEDRMMFLNQLDSKPIKDDMKVNSTSTYKKSMSEKAKKLAKYYNC
jgi:hypothetical protein